MAIRSQRKQKILWIRITVAMAMVAVTSSVLARVIPLTLVDREDWNSNKHSIDSTSRFIFVGFPQSSFDSQTSSVADGSLRRAILVSKDEYEAGEVSFEQNGERFMVPIQELSFIEPNRERRNQLVSKLNDEIATRPNKWDWTSVDVETRSEGDTNNEKSKYTSLTIWGRGSWFPISGFRYEYVATRATVEPRRIVQVHYEAQGGLLAFGVMMASSMLALGCVFRLVYLFIRDWFAGPAASA